MMNIVGYEWRYGSRIVGTDAETSAKELNRIRRKRGKVTREIVAEEAKATNSPHHAHVYGIGDREAVWQFRLVRANEIIRAVVAVYDAGEEQMIKVPAFPMVDASPEAGRQFYPMETIMANGDLKREMIEEFLQRMRGYRRILGAVQQLANVWKAFDDVKLV